MRFGLLMLLVILAGTKAPAYPQSGATHTAGFVARDGARLHVFISDADLVAREMRQFLDES